MDEETVEEIMAEDEPPTGIAEYAGDFLVNYGWFLALGAAAAYLTWTQVLGPWVVKWWERRVEDEQSGRYHKDPDVALARMQAMEAARDRMQAAHDLAAASYAQKLLEQEEKKRQLKIADWEQHEKGLGYRNKTRVEEESAKSHSLAAKAKPKAKLRNNDFNPLMGGGAGSGFRPSRRGGAGGGG